MTSVDLDPVFLLAPEFQHDPFSALASRRTHQPVFQADDMPVWMLTRYDDVVGLRDETLYSTRLIKILREQIDGPNMIQMDGKDHHRNRALIGPAFRPRVVAAFVDTTVRPLVERLLEGFRDRGEAELMREFCEPLPFHTIAELIGLEAEDQPRLSRIYKDAIAADPLQMGPEQMERSMAAKAEFDKLLVPLVAERRREPGDDFVSQLVQAESKDGQRLDDEEVLGFLRFMLPAGEESTMSALGTAVLELLRNPDQLEALRADPSLVASAVEEGLRFRAPIAYINRVAITDHEVRGIKITEGSLVLGSVNSANRDPEVFGAPDEFLIDRDPNRHISFGAGVHMCIGAPLARAELQVALEVLVRELPNLRLAPGYEPHYEGLFSNSLRELRVEFDRS